MKFCPAPNVLELLLQVLRRPVSGAVFALRGSGGLGARRAQQHRLSVEQGLLQR